MMKKWTFLCAAVFTILSIDVARAQLPPFMSTFLLPANPTSADNLKLSMAGRTCGGFLPYASQPYLVSMSQNNITVTLGPRVNGLAPLCPPTPREEIDLGRLPAGDYTLTVISEGITGGAPREVVFANAPFTVTNARLQKTAPYVRLDYSGHWWDPNDAGWGLFIWHDARDNVLAAWFTYTPDGKPMWYVFQPTWRTSTTTIEVPLMQTSRPPGTTSPPPNPTSIMIAGTAGLDFTNAGTADEGKLIYTFTGGAKQTRIIQRFKP